MPGETLNKAFLIMENQGNEIWQDVIGYKGLYQVSSVGRVKSLKRTIHNAGIHETFIKKEKVLSKYIDSCGYEFVSFSIQKIRVKNLTHRLVASTFIPNPENKPQVNHKNGIRKDNRVENLEWCTNSENQIHSHRVLGNKSSNFGKFNTDNHLSKSCKQYSLNGVFIAEYGSRKEAERITGINNASISKCVLGKSKSSGGYRWGK